jgi:hypothetical protein
MVAMPADPPPIMRIIPIMFVIMFVMGISRIMFIIGMPPIIPCPALPLVQTRRGASVASAPALAMSLLVGGVDHWQAPAPKQSRKMQSSSWSQQLFSSWSASCFDENLWRTVTSASADGRTLTQING